MRTLGVRFAGGLVALAVALTGCSSSTATSPEHSARPPASPATRAGDHIVITGTGLDFADSAGDVVDTAEFSDDAAATRDTITRWLGIVPVTTSDESSGYCSQSAAAIVTDTWDSSLALTHQGPVFAEAGFHSAVLAPGPKANGSEIVTPQGFGVGHPSADLIAAMPATATEVGSGVARILPHADSELERLRLGMGEGRGVDPADHRALRAGRVLLRPSVGGSGRRRPHTAD